MSDTKEKVKQFILEQFLPGADPEELTDTTTLISGGILDSLATMKLVTYIEQTFGITVQAHEADEDNLGTLRDIERLIQSKR